MVVIEKKHRYLSQKNIHRLMLSKLRLVLFQEKDFQNRQGLLCTTVNQTIVDLLEKNGDEQIITESLANYYEEHGQSFEELVIPEHLNARFEKVQ